MSWCEQLTQKPALPKWRGPAQVHLKLSSGDVEESDDEGRPLPPKDKKCSKCQTVKPLTKEHYFANHRSKTGFLSECKECHKQRDRDEAQRRYEESQRRK